MTLYQWALYTVSLLLKVLLACMRPKIQVCNKKFKFNFANISHTKLSGRRSWFEGPFNRQMVYEDYPEGSGDSVDMGQNLTHDREGQKHAREQDTKENILSNIKAMMRGDGGTSPSQQRLQTTPLPGYDLLEDVSTLLLSVSPKPWVSMNYEFRFTVQYRVTHQVGKNLSLTLIWKLRFSIRSLY